MMARRYSLLLFIMSLALASLLLSVCNGSTAIPLNQLLLPQNSVILYHIRFPHTFAAFITGSLLGLSGALMQLLLQNPLADPYVLGISSAAAFFTLLGMLVGLSAEGLLGAGCAGSLLAISFIFLLARRHRWQPHRLLLIGISLASGFSACSSFILLVSSDHALHSMLFWLTGDLSTIGPFKLALFVLIGAAALSSYLSPRLNLLLRGEDNARTLGLATTRFRVILFVMSAILTATAVNIGGAIGFVGLIIPHGVRLVLKTDDQRLVLPLSLLLGGTLLTVADVIARTLFAPTELPVGMVMTLIGVPVFIWLLLRS